VDAAVIGAGPGGLAACRELSAAGRRTALIDLAPKPGGNIWRGGRMPSWACGALRDPLVESFFGAAVVDAAQGWVGAVQGGTALEIRAEAIILATGARDLALPFPGWDLPGVFTAGGLQAMLKGGLRAQGRRFLVAGSGPLLLAVAAEVVGRGGEAVLADQAPASAWARWGLIAGPSDPASALGLAGRLARTERCPDTAPARIRAEAGRLEVELFSHRGSRIEEFDAAGIGWGLTPNLELARLLGCAVEPHGVVADAECRTSRPGVWAVGEALGAAGAQAAIEDGSAAGRSASGLPCTWTQNERRNAGERKRRELRRLFALRPDLLPRPDGASLLCRCEGTTWDEAVGFPGAESAKLASRCGMGLCQGRICGSAMEALSGWAPPSVRPPLFPAPAAALAELWQNSGQP
jgi:NADPH-dependent 2,4-dienoyl-CoA reductase/sulfur reductase-like enzyme